MHKKQRYWGHSKDFETVTWMLKKKHRKCHCAGFCETFDNRVLSALTESAEAVNNSALSKINNNKNSNNSNKEKS